MQSIYREELSRAFINKRFLLVFLLAGISFTYGFFQVKNIISDPVGAITIWQEILSRGYYGFFACVMAVLPFADSLSIEKNERAINHFLVRIEYKKFIRAKFFAVVLSGSAAVVIPAIILLILCFLVYPANPVQIPNLSFSVNEMLPGSVIPPGNIVILSSFGYAILCLLFLDLFGATYAILAMGTSFQTKNLLIVFGIPFILYSFGYYFIPTSRHLNWLVSTETTLIPNGNLFPALIQYCVLGLFFCVNVLLFGKKERQVLS